MGAYVYTPVNWNREAEALWSGGDRDAATELVLKALDANPAPDPDAFIQSGFYLFQLFRFDLAGKVLEYGTSLFPDHPMILLTLGTSFSRTGEHWKAIPILERFLALEQGDASAYDALAMSCSVTGDVIRARLFGTLALAAKDAITADRRGVPRLTLRREPGTRRRIIAFSLFGSNPRYLRGALHNVIAARTLYPGWTCRFIVDDSVDATFCAVMAEEGAEIIHDASSDTDIRHLLTRRFLVADDPEVGYFIVRDCDSVVSKREAVAVSDWIDSGLPFHAMRDWYTHTDPMLAGMWGGVAGVLPDMKNAIADYRDNHPLNTNWDQAFLSNQVWPAVRDQILVHDRLFETHATRPFPTPTPPVAHVGQNEYAVDKQGQAAALAAFADRIPALSLPRSLKLDFQLG